MKRAIGYFIGLMISILTLISCTGTIQQSTLPEPPSCFDTIYPVIYTCTSADNGDRAFRTVPQQKAKVKLIPNLETREQMHMTEITGIIGAHQFLLDHDLVSGFVHRYTQNMFNQLQPGDFVMKFEADTAGSFVGSICFIRKDQMAVADSLGQNIAFFRQWRLSQINYTKKEDAIYVKMDTCKYYTRCVCPASKPGSGRPEQIPFWHRGKTGQQPLTDFTSFSSEDGGTVVIVWEAKDGTWFQDIHSSWSEVITRAIEISKKYQADPAICISDAGPFSRKVKAGINFTLKTSDLDVLAPYGKRFGAGYGYLPVKQ